jgi:hypothetical protein
VVREAPACRLRGHQRIRVIGPPPRLRQGASALSSPNKMLFLFSPAIYLSTTIYPCLSIYTDGYGGLVRSHSRSMGVASGVATHSRRVPSQEVVTIRGWCGCHATSRTTRFWLRPRLGQ